MINKMLLKDKMKFIFVLITNNNLNKILKVKGRNKNNKNFLKNEKFYLQIEKKIKICNKFWVSTKYSNQ